MKWNKLLKILIFGLIFAFAISERIKVFDTVGDDIYAYKRAIYDLVSGVNPYKWTVESFSNPEDPSNHGFAYLPGLMYVNLIGYIIHVWSVETIPLEVLWKIPILLADLGTGILLILFFKDKGKYSIPLTAFSLLVWFFNPYFYSKDNYVYTDPLPIFFMFLSLYLLEKKSDLSAIFYTFAVSLKTFPIILLPLMLIKSSNWKRYLGICVLLGIIISLPFILTLEDLSIYIGGALLVHGERFMQGRPFLFYLSYYNDIELIQIIPLSVYTTLASFLGWILGPLVYFKTKIKDIYVLSLVPFICFYTFTPVLNRTYTMWWLPLLIAGSYNLFDKYLPHKLSFLSKFLFVFVVVGFWYFNYWYLSVWKDGFHIWRP